MTRNQKISAVITNRVGCWTYEPDAQTTAWVVAGLALGNFVLMAREDAEDGDSDAIAFMCDAGLCEHPRKTKKNYIGGDGCYFLCDDCGLDWGERESPEHAARRHALMSAAAAATEHFNDDELERYAAQQRGGAR